MWWITGAYGLLGKEICELFTLRGIPYIPTDKEVDICNPSAVERFYSEHTPIGVINCAAYTAVDNCETLDLRSNELAVNYLGPKNLATTCKKYNITLIHFSSDYVFNGKNCAPYYETDQPSPLTQYGRSKMKGDMAIMAIDCQYYIIRISWLYGKHGGNFIDTVIRLFQKDSPLKVVDDQIGSPTSAKDVADLVAFLTTVKRDYGLYHFSGDSETTWYGVAQEIKTLLSYKNEILPITTEEAEILFNLLAPRPRYSYLAKTKLQNTFGYDVKLWVDSLNSYLIERKLYASY